MEDKLLLWPGREAPYTQDDPTRLQPSLKPFPMEGARGAVVVCPGGAYHTKAPHEGDPIARMLNAQGIAAYVLDYRVAPCHREAPLADALRAIRLVRSLGYQKAGILGFSAGGNLCCTAATLYDAGDPGAADPIDRLSSRPDVFVPCYAVVTMNRKYTHLGSRQNLLGDAWEDDVLARRYSAEENVTADTPPAFIWHTAADQGVPVENSLLLASALAAHHVRFELHVYPEGRHGLGLAQEMPPASQWGNDCCRWLLEKGFGV